MDGQEQATGLDTIKREVAESVTVMGSAAALITGFRSTVASHEARIAELQKLAAAGDPSLGEKLAAFHSEVSALGGELDTAQKGLEAAMAVNTQANAEVAQDPAAAAAVSDVIDANNPPNPDAPTA